MHFSDLPCSATRNRVSEKLQLISIFNIQLNFWAEAMLFSAALSQRPSIEGTLKPVISAQMKGSSNGQSLPQNSPLGWWRLCGSFIVVWGSHRSFPLPSTCIFHRYYLHSTSLPQLMLFHCHLLGRTHNEQEPNQFLWYFQHCKWKKTIKFRSQCSEYCLCSSLSSFLHVRSLNAKIQHCAFNSLFHGDSECNILLLRNS